MPLRSGTRLGPYEVLSAVGAGGMGEVYRARDLKLGRDVALKLIHPQFEKNPDHLARFRTEAQSLAALNHPHIATIFELDEMNGTICLVMELVEGETLLEKLAEGPLPVEEAIRFCAQVAAALEAAHDKGIIHRDLKPANIKITPEGLVKVLDFGLAKALTGRDSTPNLSQPPTGTGEGMILGTASYMSPEQARGRSVDRRTDIWAFGCVLFECLTGSRSFAGDTVSDTIAGILEREPGWRQLPAATPSTVRALLRRCLQKDVHRRLRDIGDARLYLEDALNAPEVQGEIRPAETPRRRFNRAVAASAMLLVGAALGAIVSLLVRRSDETEPARPAEFVIALPAGERLAGLDFPAVAISPDGLLVAYVGTRGGRSQLFVRRMNSVDPVPLPGTADATSPFFSPDSRWIAFFAAGKLKKVPVGGGVPVVLCDAPIGFGGSWGVDDVIVFAPTTGAGLSRVLAAGGVPTRATKLDAGKGEFSHRWPELLPDGKTVLFTVGTVGSWDDAQIVAESLTSGERHVLVQGGTDPHFAPTGHLLYARGGQVMAVRFDPNRLATDGVAASVLNPVLQSADGAAQISVSRAGDVVYVPGTLDSANHQLVTIDRSGSMVTLAGPLRAYSTPRVAPTGRAVAVAIANGNEDLWTYDMSQGALKQLTFDANNSAPTWTPDGSRIVFSSTRSGAANLFSIGVDGGVEERLTTSDNAQVPGSWSPDGRVLAFVERSPTTGRDLWLLTPGRDRALSPFLATPFDESSPRFAPDGRWIAYVSNESGQNEVYVASATDSSRRRRVSEGGGAEPVWSPSGKELFYRAGDRLMAARFSGGEHDVGQAQAIFDASTFDKGTLDAANYDITPDGARFVAVKAGANPPPQTLHVALNGLALLVAATARR